MSAPHHHFRPFGADTFGMAAERFARFFGTPKFIIGQTILVLIWILLNGAGIIFRWDPYPFILLNLAFSTQAAYAAPLILLAQTRQADRDKARSEADENHREELSQYQIEEIRENTEITNQIRALAVQIHELAEVIHDHIAESK